MGLKKLAYIFFILIIAVLHSITLNLWLSNDVEIAHESETKINSDTDSLLNSKRGDLITISKLGNVNH